MNDSGKLLKSFIEDIIDINVIVGKRGMKCRLVAMHADPKSRQLGALSIVRKHGIASRIPARRKACFATASTSC